MMRQLKHRIFSHCVAIVAGASSALIALKYYEKDEKGSKRMDHDVDSRKGSTFYKPKTFDGSEVQSKLPIIKSPVTILRPNPKLEIAFDARSKNPVYVMEHVCLGTKESRADRTSMKFYEAKDLSSHHRSRNGYYHKSGFDRGHMAAAANYTTDDEMSDTFSLLNVSPQYPVMNRAIWSRLEELIRKFVREKSGTHDAIVITGPLWLPGHVVKDSDGKRRDWYQYSFYGFGSPPSIIQIPTHFFKVVLMLDKSRENDFEVDSFAAFVIPNTNFANSRSVNLQDYLVRITDLEATTGISFFPNVEEERLEVFDLVTEDMWMKHNVHAIDSSVVGVEINNSLSKSRKAKVRKKLHEIERKHTLPVHLCADGSCREIIRINQSRISG